MTLNWRHSPCYLLVLCTVILGNRIWGQTVPPEPPKANPVFASTVEWFGHVDIVIDKKADIVRPKELTERHSRVYHTVSFNFHLTSSPDIVRAMQAVSAGLQANDALISKLQPGVTKRVFFTSPLATENTGSLQIDDESREKLTDVGEAGGPGGVPVTTSLEGHFRGNLTGKFQDLKAVAELRLDLTKQTYELWMNWDDNVPVTMEGNLPDPPKTKPAVGFTLNEKNRKLPETGDVISESRALTKEELGRFEGDPRRAKGMITWTIALKPPPPPDLILSIENYETWTPAASNSETVAGKTMTILAYLRAPDGTLSTQVCKSITFNLPEVSQEPGICLNFPENPASSLDDLSFDAKRNPFLKIEAKGRKAVAIEPGPRARATLSCFDWGAWGSLRVEAITDTGEHLVGFLEDDPAKKRTVLIPKRDPGSKIANAWKKGKPWAAYSDDDDNESTAKNSNDGDGLSLYEEYRGFYENDKHVQGDPMKKDFFIANKNSKANKGAEQARVQAGIDLFAKDGEIRVFSQVKVSELKDRVINFNHGTSHLGDQHGVIVEPPTGTISGYFEAVAMSPSAPHGSPKHVRDIIMASDVFGFPTPKPAGRTGCGDPVVVALAHELFHTCNVLHHGDGDLTVRWDFTPNPDGKCTETPWDEKSNAATGPPHRVTLYDSSGLPHNFTTTGTAKLNVGKKGGQCSGDQSCVMRYDYASAYYDPTSADPNARYDFSDHGAKIDCTETSLCESSSGTGINANNANFGDATVGNCKAQVKIKDF